MTFRTFLSNLILVVFMISLVSCEPKPIENYADAGVSKSLADFRKSSIHNINYKLYFFIPENQDDYIPANAIIDFDLSDVSQDLLLDFNVADPQFKLSANSNPNFTFLNEHIIIPKSSLVKGKNQIQIEFIAGNKSLNRNKEYLYTLFVPDRASTAFPCFDQPNLKATYELSLEIPKSWSAAANAPKIRETKHASTTTLEFAKTKALSTYLFSFAAGKFESITKTMDGREMTLLHRETDQDLIANNTDEIFKLHNDALNWLEDYTDVKYPFDKFDFVLIPFFQYSGMEHPGAILYRASRLFLDENASINQKLRRANLIAHETAHMWYGDLVTMQWFDDVWLKEVFAGFMADKIVNPGFPEINHDLKFLLGHYPASYAVDRTIGANPIAQKLDNMKNAGSLYGGIIYNKAPIVMNHLELMIGKDKLQEGLQQYLKTFAYDNATWDDLISILDQKTSHKLEPWNNSWIKEAGMPTIFAEHKDKGIQINQLDPEGKERIWAQTLYSEFYNEDISGEKMQILLDQTSVEITTVNPEPAYKLLNHDGVAYGYFKHDQTDFSFIERNIIAYSNPMSKGVIWINMFENMLHQNYDPRALLQLQIKALKTETNEQLIHLLLGQISTNYWQFHTNEGRLAINTELESCLWELIKSTKKLGLKKSYYGTYLSIALSEKALNNLFQIWDQQKKVSGLKLSENDFTNLAYQLALKLENQSESILNTQFARIENQDRKDKMEFIMPSLSNKQEIRDSFFESLSDAENRAHEPWVGTALRFLHHPLRAENSVKYLAKSLDLLYEIKITGDIFFPMSWLSATFWGHQSKHANEIVTEFLAANPNYHQDLKLKILQSSDFLRRNQ